TPVGTTYYLYDPGGQLLGEYDASGQPIKEYVHLEGEPIAQVDNTSITYLHTDHLATPRKATNGAGQVVWQWESEAFGNALPQSSGIAVNLRFPGQYYDAETGLYYNYFRYYDPSTGRYITSDPIGLDGGLNTFGYVEGNPTNRADFFGLFSPNDGFPPVPIPNGPPKSSFPPITPGNAMSDSNGNTNPGYTEQDWVCTSPACFLNNFPSMVDRCIKHDACYEENQCNASSWQSSIMGGTKSCNKCNIDFFK
ncbi:MAG: hypothetical protein GY814_12940, partial [Gammaproteobacteria bacterium]|nr:hypothetical protein [Gammaproteobacteria bacterium]